MFWTFLKVNEIEGVKVHKCSSVPEIKRHAQKNLSNNGHRWTEHLRETKEMSLDEMVSWRDAASQRFDKKYSGHSVGRTKNAASIVNILSSSPQQTWSHVLEFISNWSLQKLRKILGETVSESPVFLLPGTWKMIQLTRWNSTKNLCQL